jgi:hypothetical protein
MKKWYIIKTNNKEIHRFTESCLYNAKKYAKSWLLSCGYNPQITKCQVMEL